MSIKLLETIKCQDGKLLNIKWHNLRFNHARQEYFGLQTKMNLVNFIKVPSGAKKGLFRCRITYSKAIDKLEFIPHEHKTINRLKLVEDNQIDYHFKYADRNRLNELYDKRGECDDILIVKNGCITDSFTANPIFFDGVYWWSPDTPLLPGTQRARLIAEHKISVCRITPNDLSKYEKIGLINAMWDMENMPVMEVTAIQN
ncbi:aminotransferase class IV [Prolixibacteraceae bacterium Z1-6]|uniref:Aminotransferase class IV n=1 Tax=Draconibacterium aestuarii TaxID=2998507 RepID=A0A9X3F5H1_9BACT|nr:aminotransferase class IV [Prolixibacteraceae bacterium Z1-6]